MTGTAAAPNIYAISTTGTGGVNLLSATPTSNGLMAALGTDSFFSGDHRFGWVCFYRRDSITNPFAQIYVIALQNPNFPNYLYPVPASGQTTISSPVPPPVPPSIYGYSPPNAAAIQAQFYQDPTGLWCVELSYPSGTSMTSGNGITGAYALIAGGNYIGRFVRLGAQVPTSIVSSASGLNPLTGGPAAQDFYLQPGWDFTAADIANPSLAAPGTLKVWMIGAAPLADPAGSGEYTGPFSGPNQDIGVATGFIRVNTTNN